MNSAALDRIEARFAGRATLDIVCCARVFARGHAAHAADLRDKHVAPHAMASHARKISRAKELDRFWSASALHFAIVDLGEEHAAALPRTLAADLKRFGDRQLRDVADPRGADCLQLAMRLLLPPRNYMPAVLPAVLIEAFGADLDAECATAVHTKNPPPPVRQRIRPRIAA